MKKIKVTMIAIIAVYVISLVVINIVNIVRPGEAAAVEFMGKVDEKSYKNGPVFVIPGSKVVRYNIRQQALPFQMDLKTTELIDIHIDGMINYNVNPKKVHLLHKNIGEQYREVLVTPLLRGALSQTIGKQSPEFIVSQPEMIREAMLYIIQDQLGSEDYIKVNDFRTYCPQFDERFETAVVDKAIAKQLAEKARIETERVKEEAKQMKEKLEAEAYGLNLKSKSLNNPLIVRYEYAKAMGNWRGDTPSTLVIGQNSGTVPFLPLSK